MSPKKKMRKDDILASQDDCKREVSTLVSIIQAIRSKSQWFQKIQDHEIRTTYKREAIDQGAHESVIDRAFCILDTLVVQCMPPTSAGVNSVAHISDNTEPDVAIRIRVSDVEFNTSRSVLTADKASMLGSTFSQRWFSPEARSDVIDIETVTQSAAVFRHIIAHLEALQLGASNLCPTLHISVFGSDEYDMLLAECDYFGLQKLWLAAEVEMYAHAFAAVAQQVKNTDIINQAFYATKRPMWGLSGANKAQRVQDLQQKLQDVMVAQEAFPSPRPARAGDEIKVFQQCPQDADPSKYSGGPKWYLHNVEEIDGQLMCRRVITSRMIAELMPIPMPPPHLFYHQHFEQSYFLDQAVCCEHMLPEVLKNSLERNLDALLHEVPLDMHPGSNFQVFDLIHPSLFSYVKGISPVTDSEALEKCAKITGDYSWLPAEIEVDEHKRVTLKSYINNLDSESKPQLTSDILDVFRLMLPMFEEVVGYPLHSQTLQVIVKAAYYILPPGETYQGENIIVILSDFARIIQRILSHLFVCV
jgi:hypothetical protein